MSNSFESLLKDALDAVLEAIELHKQGQSAPLSINVLNKTKLELELMIKTMNPKIFTPTYPRFVMDWPDDSGLVEKLIHVSYLYEKIRK